MNKIVMATLIIATFATSSAFAGLYVGAEGGYATTDTQHTSTKVFAGLQIIPNVGLEAAYSDFGAYRGSTATAISFAVVGTLPLGDTWDLFAEWGTTHNQTSYMGTAGNTDILTGFGLAYNASKNVSLRLETENYGKLPTDANGVSTTVSNWGVSLKFMF